MITLEDARGCRIKLMEPPRRIVSLVPSQTELLSSLGLHEEVVGITRFCVHPAAWHDSKVIVGGTKLLRTDRIRELRPDLIFANLEENTKQDVQRIEDIAPVFVTNVRTLDEAIDMIEAVALLTNRASAGAHIASAIRSAFETLAGDLGGDALATLRAAYLIWRNPYMSVGGDTFIHDMMVRGGFENVFGSLVRYPLITVSDLVDASPKVVFLSSEPFPFLKKHLPEIAAILPAAHIQLVDGQLFSWYGSRLIHTPDYLWQLREEMGSTR